MAVKRTPENCTEHTIEINNLKKDMETVLRHEKKFSDSIDLLEITIADLNLTVKIFNDKLKDLPEKVRKLEDKYIFVDVLNKLAWIGIGAFIAVLVNQNFVATRDKHDYSVEKHK